MYHLVYPCDRNRSAAAWSIGNHLLDALATRGAVRQYDWLCTDRIHPEPGDVLIGHPGPIGHPLTVFNRSLRGPWSRRVAIQPWNGSDEYTAQVEAVLGDCDAILAICGPYWARRFPSPWAGKVKPLDMAVDPEAVGYPVTPHAFAPSGKRRYLNIGCTLPCKGTTIIKKATVCIITKGSTPKKSKRKRGRCII